jgi:hypothetical protein
MSSSASAYSGFTKSRFYNAALIAGACTGVKPAYYRAFAFRIVALSRLYGGWYTSKPASPLWGLSAYKDAELVAAYVLTANPPYVPIPALTRLTKFVARIRPATWAKWAAIAANPEAYEPRY